MGPERPALAPLTEHVRLRLEGCAPKAPACRETLSPSRVWRAPFGVAAVRGLRRVGLCWQCARRPVAWAGDRKTEQDSRLGRVGFRAGGGRVSRSGHAGCGRAKGADPGQRGQPRGKRVRKRVARPAGFEPATTCLEGRCSVQLSYGRPLGGAGPAAGRLVESSVRARSGPGGARECGPVICELSAQALLGQSRGQLPKGLRYRIRGSLSANF